MFTTLTVALTFPYSIFLVLSAWLFLTPFNIDILVLSAWLDVDSKY